MAVLNIAIDLPPKCASPNGRFHWAVKARHRKIYREHAFLMAKVAMQEYLSFNQGEFPWQSATLQICYQYDDKSCRKRDDDNLNAALKWARDGFADAGIVRDDSDFSQLTPLQRKGDAPLFIVRIEERMTHGNEI